MVKSIMNPPKALHNTDKVLWVSPDGDSIFLTEDDRGLGICVAGRITVMPPKTWLNQLDEAERLRAALGDARARISKLEGYIVDNVIEGKMK